MQHLKIKEKAPGQKGLAQQPARHVPRLLEYDPKTLIIENVIQGLKGKDDGTFLDALLELRGVVLSKRYKNHEIYITQKMIDVATNPAREPQKRQNALLALKEIAIQRCENKALADKIVNSLPRIFKKEDDHPDVRENAVSALFEIVRHGGFAIDFSKELIRTIGDTGLMVLSESLTYRYLALSALQELGKYAVRKKSAQIEQEIAKTLDMIYNKTTNETIHKDLNCAVEAMLQGSG